MHIRIPIIYLLLFFIVGFPNHAHSQNIPNLPAFFPTAEHSYTTTDGLPDNSITNVFMDKEGRLHIAPNSSATAFNQVLYEYDGKQAYPTKLKINPKPLRIYFDGQDSLGRIFGHYRNRRTKEGKLDPFTGKFIYDPVLRTSQIFEVENKINRLERGQVLNREGTFFKLLQITNSNQYEIISIDNNIIASELQFELKINLGNQRIIFSVTDEDFWIGGSSHFIYRINRKDGKIHPYALPGEEKRVASIVNSSSKAVWITLSKISPYEYPSGNGGWNNTFNRLYLWDHKTDTFILNPFQPKRWKDEDIKLARVFKDAKGNLLLRYQNQNNEVNATLLDNNQQIYDYSAVMSDHMETTGIDFKKSITLFDPGLRFVEVSTRNAIKKNTETGHTRKLIELDAFNIRVDRGSGGGGELLSFEKEEWVLYEYTDFCQFQSAKGKDIIKEKTSDKWKIITTNVSPSVLGFLRYNIESGLCDTFNLGLYPRVFDLMDDGQLAIATRKHVYLWDTKNEVPKLLTKEPFHVTFNQLFVGKDGFIWLASQKGLMKVDSKTGIREWVNLIPGQTTNVVSIHQDAKGNVWLGTVMNGIIILDPSTGKTQVIDETNGLSNNIVVSLLKDNDGDIWAGTFSGITILKPDGTVFGKLYEEHGLANNECNRWSAMKMKDGRLCFGSIGGVTIIDPVLSKARLAKYNSPRIYLTDLYSDSLGESSVKKNLLPLFEENKPIVLPANNRNLKINFALSNYSAPEKSTFAYQVEGIDKEWHFIGSQTQLSLNALPAGSYDIIIKGSDGHGKWSNPPIIIPVDVAQFFYLQWWFFVLCTLPFLVFFLLWQQRQRGERKRLELEVKNRTSIIQEQTDKLREVDSMKSRLYTNITHEFRTPLTVISGMTDIMEREPDKAKELIRRNSKGLLRLVNQLLDLAKLESGHLKLELKQADVVPYIQYLLESLQSFAESKSIYLQFHKETDQILMDFDENKFESIILNLLSNAIKFSKQNGQVHLTLKEENANLFIIVKDNGKGIPSNKQAFIFDRFYQVDDSQTRHGEGTGIGLTLTKNLVELMGGAIKVQSPTEEGEGTEFTVTLPIHKNAPFEIPEITASLSSSVLPIEKETQPITQEPSSPIEELPLLLLIEDNRDVAIYIEACLQNRYSVEWAINGAIGIEKSLEIIPDIIISDVMMPEKDGFEVCQTLKNDERTSHIPIVLLTAKADVESKLEGLGVGADAYLSKPFLKEELFIRLEKLVDLRKKLQALYSGKDFLSITPEPQPKVPSAEDIFLEKAANFIQENLDDAEFGNKELSRQMTMSDSQLNRKIKALTGKTLSLFIRSIRLQKAKFLLQTTNLNVSEIAYDVGFTNPAYFSSSFSKEFGVSPSEFRN
ncbi:MAG: ATP-binding protein [Bacteroidetes bacterium]|nr:ATP-binding protein [Bacteroidota bacterium]